MTGLSGREWRKPEREVLLEMEEVPVPAPEESLGKEVEVL